MVHRLWRWVHWNASNCPSSGVFASTARRSTWLVTQNETGCRSLLVQKEPLRQPKQHTPPPPRGTRAPALTPHMPCMPAATAKHNQPSPPPACGTHAAPAPAPGPSPASVRAASQQSPHRWVARGEGGGGRRGRQGGAAAPGGRGTAAQRKLLVQALRRSNEDTTHKLHCNAGEARLAAC